MAPETRKLDEAARERLSALIDRFGGRREVAARMAQAGKTRRPGKEEIEAKILRLRRLVDGDVGLTPTSRKLIAEAIGISGVELLCQLFPEEFPTAPPTRKQVIQTDNGQQDPEDPETDTGRIYRRLNKASELTASRANIVRDEQGLQLLTLENQLYVHRDIEDEIARALERRTTDPAFVVIDGEAGTGKSSLLWATARMLRQGGAEAWLIDATELPSIFGQERDGAILSEPMLRLFRHLTASSDPVVLIDTIDVSLNRGGTDVYAVSLVTELIMAGVTVVVASRPGEARMLSAHRPHTIMLFDYSDTEFPTAVTAYAKAYVRNGKTLSPAAHAESVLEAAAQGYPIKELCRNPLTLRMLYAVYAPQEINLRDVDVITLFREFWRRRVESDQRSDSVTPGSDRTDLSDAALRIATAMLVAGTPELPKERLMRELQEARIDRGSLDQLRRRGVLRISNLAPDHLAGFFHQSFFEHAAALAIIRLGGVAAIAALAGRWIEYGGNLFLGAILERALVLSEYEPAPVQHEAERIMGNLSGASGKSVAAYVFIHRRSVPDVLANDVSARVAEGDTLTVERLLAIGANAVQSRRLALVELLGVILRSGEERPMRRALELLWRFVSPELAVTRRIVRQAQLSRIILDEPEKHAQSRELYLRFLARGGSDDADWSLSELARFLADGLKRRSDQACLEALEAAAALAVHIPGLARRLEERSGLQRPNMASRITSEEVARKMGDLYRVCWKDEALEIEQAIAETADKSGLAMWARLHALGDMILAGDAERAARAFELTGRIDSKTVRVMAARLAWARCLPVIVREWSTDDADLFLRHARALAGKVLASERNAHADILYHALRHGDFTKEICLRLLDEVQLDDAAPWLDTRVMGHRLVQGAALGIIGAQTALELLMRDPSKHELLARGVLAQFKGLPMSGEVQQNALRLAVNTNNAEAAFDILQKSDTLEPRGAFAVKPIRQMIEKLWRTRNPKSTRIGNGLVFELVRLSADVGLDWETIVSRLSVDKDDIGAARLVGALCLIAKRDEATMRARARWLRIHAKGDGQATRDAVLALHSDVSDDDSEIASEAIDDLFDLAFANPTDGGLIERLQGPLFSLYNRKDPRLISLVKTLVDRSAPMSQQTCHRVCGTFKRLFGLIVERMDDATRQQWLSRVPGLDRRLGRMIVEGVARAGTGDLAARLKAIAEDQKSDREIVALAGRFLHRELRVSGLKRWPELYELTANP
jgi:hypothetical protein